MDAALSEGVDVAELLVEENICFRPTTAQKERVASLLKRTVPRWNKTEWMRHFIELHRHVEAVVEPLLPSLEAYAVRERLTVQAARRKPDDWEWQVDALVSLAKERLAQLQDSGELQPKA